jgi:hypothetical protein
MRLPLLACLFLISTWTVLRADAPAQPPVGIIVLRAIAGYDAAATWFTGIQWTDKDSGYVVAPDGHKVPFLNDAIGRIVYFDQNYYEEVDHNQYWIDWRAGLQSRELLLPPIQTNGLQQADVRRLGQEQAALEDVVGRFSNGATVIGPLIETLKDQISKLNSGFVLQNGSWIAAKDAASLTDSVPTVGETQNVVTFTTTDGKRFENAHVSTTETGLSVLTSDGGASVSFDRVPQNISGFPKTVQEKIRSWREKQAQQVADGSDGSSATNSTGWGAWILSCYHAAVDKISGYFSSSKSAPSAPADTNAAPDSASPPPATSH